MLKRFHVRAPIAVFASVAFLGLSSATAYSQTSQTSPTAAQTFKTNCAVCHGEDGTGSALGKRLHAPDLHSKEVQSQPTATLAQVITKGKNNMPPFGDSLDAKQINNLIRYIRHFRAGASANAK